MGTPQSWSAVMDHTTDAGFRAWGSDFAAKVVAAGLTQTADTGQINWASVVRAGVNADAGYETYYLTGTLHATAPIYIKFYYGTGSVSTIPRLRYEIGTGTNGSGTITGTAKTGVQQGSASGPSSTVVAYQNYVCANEGFFGFVLRANSIGGNTSFSGGAIVRTTNAAGVWTADGALCWFSTNGTNTNYAGTQSLQFSGTPVAYTPVSQGSLAQTAQCYCPGAPTSSSITGSGDTQLYCMWGLFNNQATPFTGMGGYFLTEASEGTTFTCTVKGSTSRTYIALGRQNGQVVANAANPTSFGAAMLWEG